MYRKLLVLVDDRLDTQSATLEAIEIAQVHGAVILFFYILPPYRFPISDIPPAVALSPEEFQRQANAHAHTLLVAASELAELAGVQSYRAMGSSADNVQCVCDIAERRQCDLIVVGTDGHNAMMRILEGSIIPGLITAARVPVLICRGSVSGDGLERGSRASLKARERREALPRQRNSAEND